MSVNKESTETNFIITSESLNTDFPLAKRKLFSGDVKKP